MEDVPCEYINQCPDLILHRTNDSEEYYLILCGIATDITEINSSIYCHDQVKHLKRPCLVIRLKKQKREAPEHTGWDPGFLGGGGCGGFLFYFLVLFCF